MNRDNLIQLLKGYDPAIQEVIAKVIFLEQEHIHLTQPKLKDDIRKIIEKAEPKYKGQEKDIEAK